jgi:small subunit ribosomal protein S10
MPKTQQREKTNKKKIVAPNKKKTAKTVKKNIKEDQKIRIKIRAYDHRLVDESARKIIDNSLRQGAKICGPVPLPTEIHKWTVNSSTFVHKDTRDQYEMRIYKRIIDIINPSAKIIDSLSRIDLPAGIDIEIKY